MKKERGWNTSLRFASYFLMIIFLMASFFLGHEYLKLSRILKGGAKQAAALQKDINLEDLHQKGNHRINILLLGISGDGYRGPEMTDTIIIASIDPLKNKIALFSIPRDLWVKPEELEAMKINGIYTFAKNKALKVKAKKEEAELAGYSAIEKEIQKITGLPIHYHLRIDFSGFEQVIDALSGLDIDVDNANTVVERLWDVPTAQYYTLNVQEGRQHFDGKRALFYARSRFTSLLGDFSRNARQRKLLKALVEKLFSFETFLNPVKISKLTSAIENHLETNINIQEFMALYKILKNIKSKDISSFSGLTGPPEHHLIFATIDNKISIVCPRAGIANFSAIQAVIRKSLEFEHVVESPLNTSLPPTQIANDKQNPIFSPDAQSKKSICLNMIVKNESQVITRCLESVKSLIDYWVIVDTGSTDGTQQIIKDYMQKQGIAGELHESPWVNFSHNRNEALAIAKGKSDYILIIDADEVLSVPQGYSFPLLDKDCYYVESQYDGTVYLRNQLIKSSIDWKWVGVVHEMLISSKPNTFDKLEQVANIVHTDGARAKDPSRFYKDAKLLEAALQEEPNNLRTLYFLAQSYRDAGELELAIKHYQERAELGGLKEEVFWSLYQTATLQEKLKKPYEMVVNSYQKAIDYRPSRIEPLFRLATYYRLNGDFLLAYHTCEKALKMPPSQDAMQEKWIGNYGLLLEYSTSAFYAGKYEDCLKACQKLLADSNIPMDTRIDIEKNIPFIIAEMEPKAA